MPMGPRHFGSTQDEADFAKKDEGLDPDWPRLKLPKSEKWQFWRRCYKELGSNSSDTDDEDGPGGGGVAQKVAEEVKEGDKTVEGQHDKPAPVEAEEEKAGPLEQPELEPSPSNWVTTESSTAKEAQEDPFNIATPPPIPPRSPSAEQSSHSWLSTSEALDAESSHQSSRSFRSAQSHYSDGSEPSNASYHSVNSQHSSSSHLSKSSHHSSHHSESSHHSDRSHHLSSPNHSSSLSSARPLSLSSLPHESSYEGIDYRDLIKELGNERKRATKTGRGKKVKKMTKKQVISALMKADREGFKGAGRWRLGRRVRGAKRALVDADTGGTGDAEAEEGDDGIGGHSQDGDGVGAGTQGQAPPAPQTAAPGVLPTYEDYDAHYVNDLHHELLNERGVALPAGAGRKKKPIIDALLAADQAGHRAIGGGEVGQS